jgi:hypothetical protein
MNIMKQTTHNHTHTLVQCGWSLCAHNDGHSMHHACVELTHRTKNSTNQIQALVQLSLLYLGVCLCAEACAQ